MLSASERTQRSLEQELITCKSALEEAVARGDLAHSEALSYLSKMRQQDRQAEIDRLELHAYLCFRLCCKQSFVQYAIPLVLLCESGIACLHCV